MAWQSAHELTLAVYRESSNFPKTEMFGLTNQLRRSAASVGANLAEGYGRHSRNELRRFALIANGSLEEVKNFLLLAADLGYLERTTCDELLQMAGRTGRLIGGLEKLHG